MKQQAVCTNKTGGYEYRLTEGKVYEVEQVEGIFESRPLYVFIDDNGKESSCHTYRFKIINKEKQENG